MMRGLLIIALAAGLAGCIAHAPEDGSAVSFVQTNWQRPGQPLVIRPQGVRRTDREDRR